MHNGILCFEYASDNIDSIKDQNYRHKVTVIVNGKLVYCDYNHKTSGKKKVMVNLKIMMKIIVYSHV